MPDDDHQEGQAPVDLPQWLKEVDGNARDAYVTIGKLEELARDLPETGPMLSRCREVRGHLSTALAGLSDLPMPPPSAPEGGWSKEKLPELAKRRFSALEDILSNVPAKHHDYIVRVSFAGRLETLINQWAGVMPPEELVYLIAAWIPPETTPTYPLEDQKKISQAVFQLLDLVEIFDDSFDEVMGFLGQISPLDTYPLLSEKTLTVLQQKAADHPQISPLVEQFLLFRQQIQVLGQELRTMTKHRDALAAVQDEFGMPLSDEEEQGLNVWIDDLLAAEERAIPDQVPITAFDEDGLLAAAEGNIVHPDRLTPELRRLQALKTLLAASVDQAGGIFQDIEDELFMLRRDGQSGMSQDIRDMLASKMRIEDPDRMLDISPGQDLHFQMPSSLSEESLVELEEQAKGIDSSSRLDIIRALREQADSLSARRDLLDTNAPEIRQGLVRKLQEQQQVNYFNPLGAMETTAWLYLQLREEVEKAVRLVNPAFTMKLGMGSKGGPLLINDLGEEERALLAMELCGTAAITEATLALKALREEFLRYRAEQG